LRAASKRVLCASKQAAQPLVSKPVSRSNSDHDERTEQFVRLLGQHERSLNAYILSLVPDWHAAGDIAQETRVKLWQQFDKYDSSKDFGGWARAIAHYEVLHHRSKTARQKLRFGDEVVTLLADEAAEEIEQTDDRHAALAVCLERLTDLQRRQLMACYQPGASMREVAQAEGRTYEAVRKTVRRVLHDCIESRLGKEGRP
jgi:RNA polymerase sigma-70 factor (ECF subfamily)